MNAKQYAGMTVQEIENAIRDQYDETQTIPGNVHERAKAIYAPKPEPAYYTLKTDISGLVTITCPDCGKKTLRTRCTPSIDPVNFPGKYLSQDCTNCGYYEFSYVAD